MTPSILLLGAGRMGRAMLAGWQRTGLGPSWLVDPSPDAAALADGTLRVAASPADIPWAFHPDAIVLAVKPQSAAAAMPGLAPFAADAAVLSIMAGQTVPTIAAACRTQAVVRAMPNTPAAIGQGFTAAYAAPAVTPAERALCDALLQSVGEVDWVEDEAMLDVVTAASGGGPAYVFLLAELLEAAATAQGLPPGLARRLARRTVSGAGALLATSTEDAAALRRAVASPAGTTERALAVLMAPDAWPALMHRAVAAATARSRELSS